MNPVLRRIATVAAVVTLVAAGWEGLTAPAVNGSLIAVVLSLVALYYLLTTAPTPQD